MANEQNLVKGGEAHRLTAEEASKGGKKSAETRARRKSIREDTSGMSHKLKVQYWPIDDVHPYPNNPRNNDEAVEYVANSIREFSFQQPLVVDSDGTIIAGHTRLKAAKLLGMETVPVVVADNLTPAQVNAYRLADNKVAEAATWDMEALSVELEGLEVDFDMTMFDFDIETFEPSFDDVEDEQEPDESVTVKVLFHDPDLYQTYRDMFSKMEKDGASVSIS